jgi:hypothetical protein
MVCTVPYMRHRRYATTSLAKHRYVICINVAGRCYSLSQEFLIAKPQNNE